MFDHWTSLHPRIDLGEARFVEEELKRKRSIGEQSLNMVPGSKVPVARFILDSR